MALLLQPGDPVPLPASDAAGLTLTGRWLLLWAAREPLPTVPDGLTVAVVAVEGETARRLGVQDPGEALAVLVEPGGTVLGSWAGPTAANEALTAFAQR
jgi:hypothetical protein